MLNIFLIGFNGVLSVNNRQVVLFTSITLNIALAHEFGHAFGLGHTFSDDDENKKSNKEVATLSSSFYDGMKEYIANLLRWFAPRESGKKYIFVSKSNQHKSIQNLDLQINVS